MEHAATLDLEDFEDAEFQDQLERARRQTSGRLTLMAQLFGQAQDIVTVASFAAGLLVYAPWLIVLLLVALVPVFLGEAHFNAQTYTLDFGRTPERRELDYVRQTAASVETAKEVKIFGLNRFLIEHYKRLAAGFYAANRATRAAAGRLGRRVHRHRHRRATTSPMPTSSGARLRASSRSAISPSSPARSCRLRALLEALLIELLLDGGPGALSQRSLLLLRDEAGDPVAGQPTAVPPADPRGLRVRGCRLHLSRRRALGGAPSQLHPQGGRGGGAGGRERRRQDHAGEAADAALRPRRGPHPARRPRPARIRPRRAARQHGRHLPGFRALQFHRRRQYRGRPHRRARRSANGSSGRPSAARPTRSSGGCRTATGSASASASRTASSCPAANGRRSPSHAPTCARPRC